jgi:hypothetical protein
MATTTYVTPWADVLFSALARTAGATPASFSDINSTGIYGWEFTNGKELFFPGVQVNHDYVEGSEIIPHIHWMPSTTATYTGTWTLSWIEHVSPVAGTAMSGVQTATLAFNSSLTAWQAQIGNFSANFLGTNAKISRLLQLKLALTLSSGASCFLLGLDGHYQRDGIGSKSATAKTS